MLAICEVTIFIARFLVKIHTYILHIAGKRGSKLHTQDVNMPYISGIL